MIAQGLRRLQHRRLLRLDRGLAAGMAVRHFHLAALIGHLPAARFFGFRKLRIRDEAGHRWHSKHHEEHRASHEFADQVH